MSLIRPTSSLDLGNRRRAPARKRASVVIARDRFRREPVPFCYPTTPDLPITGGVRGNHRSSRSSPWAQNQTLLSEPAAETDKLPVDDDAWPDRSRDGRADSRSSRFVTPGSKNIQISASRKPEIAELRREIPDRRDGGRSSRWRHRVPLVRCLCHGPGKGRRSTRSRMSTLPLVPNSVTH